MAAYQLANVIGVHNIPTSTIIFFTGEECITKGFDSFPDAVNHLVSEGYTVKTELQDEMSFSVWFEKANVRGGMVDRTRA